MTRQEASEWANCAAAALDGMGYIATAADMRSVADLCNLSTRTRADGVALVRRVMRRERNTMPRVRLRALLFASALLRTADEC